MSCSGTVEQSFGHCCTSQTLKMENNYAGIFQESITSSPLDSSLHKLWNEREKIFSMVTTELKLMQAQQRTAEILNSSGGTSPPQPHARPWVDSWLPRTELLASHDLSLHQGRWISHKAGEMLFYGFVAFSGGEQTGVFLQKSVSCPAQRQCPFAPVACRERESNMVKFTPGQEARTWPVYY